jgi:hypothetical protein
MSLVLTVACPIFTVQVSERLISTEDRRAGPATNEPVTRRPYDALSNKSIVYRASNAMVSMGYVGSAYLEGKPTDEWLAERLWGESLTVRTPDGRIPKCIRAVPNLRDIGFAVRALQASLESLAPNPYGISLAIAGWQAFRKNARPIFIELEKRPNNKLVTRIESPRWWPRGNLALQDIGGYLTPKDRESLGHKLVDACRSKDVVQKFERILAETVRRVSSTNPGVGSNVMSVVIPLPRRGSPYVRFLPSTEHRIEVQDAGQLSVLNASYTPWLLGSRILHPPSVIIGTWTVNLDGIEVTIHDDEPTGSTKALNSSQRRPAAPSLSRSR